MRQNEKKAKNVSKKFVKVTIKRKVLYKPREEIQKKLNKEI